MKLDFRQRLLTSTLLVGASMLASPAYAQTATPNQPGTAQDTQSTVPDQNTATNPAAAQPTGPVEANPTPTRNAQGAPVQTANDIVITGTRIPQPNLTVDQPGHGGQQRRVQLQGTTRTEDLLNSLPQVFAGQGRQRLQRRDRHRHRQSARPRPAAHPGAGQRPPPACRATRHGHPAADINFIPGSDDQARRRADRRRLVGLRRRRRLRRRQLHHGHPLHRRPARRAVQLLPARQRRQTTAARCTSRRSNAPNRQLRLSDAATSPTAAPTTRTWRSAPRSTTTAATSSPMPATADQPDHFRAGATISSCALTSRTAARSPQATRHRRQCRRRPLSPAAARPPRRTAPSSPTRRRFQVGPNRTFIPGFDAVQFRADQLLTSVPTSATRSAPFADYEISEALHPVPGIDVHGRPHGRPDRAVG